MSLSSAETLVVHVQQTQQALAVQAALAGETHKYTVSEQWKIPAKMKAIYRFLNPRHPLLVLRDRIYDFFTYLFGDTNMKAIKQSDIHTLLAEVGQELYSPIQAWIDQASAIEFVLAEECLFYPLDALYYQGHPLFLDKPITYSLHGHSDALLQVSDQWKGVLIADKTSDPEQAVLSVKPLFPDSLYFDNLEVHPEDLQNITAADFVLISGHGGPDDGDGIDLEHIPIRPETLVHMAPKLVYFDSCQLGINRGFLHSLHRSGTLYYVAPILSNESGDSSTKTIERFFGALSAGKSPADALFAARKTLYEHYTAQEDDFWEVMVRAFPFRVYRLN